MKILQLSAENVKRLVAIQITPDGHVVTIGGKNGAGKSSVLDSIAYALGGEKLIPGQPVRKGQDKAKVVVTLEDLVVTRTFTAVGTSALTVANKDGARYPSPQAILDKLVGRLSFDPIEFARMKPEQQADTLRRLVGLDFSALEKKRASVYAQRTEVNRQGKLLEHRVSELPSFSLVPEGEQSVAEIAAELDTAKAAAAVVDEYQRTVQGVVENLRHNENGAERLDEKISDLETRLQQLRSERKMLSQVVTECRARLTEWLARLEEAKAATPDLEAIRKRLEEVEATNAKVRANKRRAEAVQAVADNKKQVEDLTSHIARLDKEKSDTIGAAAFPVPGLGLSDAGITFNDIPFDQASMAEQLRVSTAVGLALNPKLKVLLIRDGSALDSTSLALMADMAAAADAQVWIERVAESKDGVSVLIEDGAVRAR